MKGWQGNCREDISPKMPRSRSDPEAFKGSDVETIASLCVIRKVPLFVLVAIVPQILQTPADRRLSRFHAPIEEIGFYFKDRRVIRLGIGLGSLGNLDGPRLRFRALDSTAPSV